MCSISQEDLLKNTAVRTNLYIFKVRSIQSKKVGLGSSSALEIHSPWLFWHFFKVRKRSSSDTQYFNVRKRRCLLVVKFCTFSKSGKYKLKKLGWALPSALKIHSPWFFGIFSKSGEEAVQTSNNLLYVVEIYSPYF